MNTDRVKLQGYESKMYLDYKDIIAVLGVSRPSAYEVIHSLPHIGGSDGLPLRLRREVFEDYLTNCEKATTIMEKFAKDKFVMIEGNRFYIRQRKGRTMVLQLCNF